MRKFFGCLAVFFAMCVESNRRRGAGGAPMAKKIGKLAPSGESANSTLDSWLALGQGECQIQRQKYDDGGPGFAHGAPKAVVPDAPAID